MEGALHSGRQRHSGIAILVPQAVGGGQRLLPARVLTFVEQIQLIVRIRERRSVHPEQAHARAGLPILAEQGADVIENLGIEARGALDRMRPRDGGEIRIAQLKLQGARLQPVLAQTAADHFGKPGQGGFEYREIAGVLVVRVLVADRFGINVGADFRVEPASRIEAARLAGQGQTPLSETLFEEPCVQPRQIAYFTDRRAGADSFP